MKPTDQWWEWQLLFGAEIRTLGEKYPAWIELTGPPGDLADQFHLLDTDTGSSVASAVHQYASTGCWPELDAPAGAMLLARLEFAERLCEAMIPLTATMKLNSPPAWTRAQALQWFLLAAWGHTGFGQMRGSLERLRRRDTPETNLGLN